MAFMQWSRDLDTGINIIDQQHRKIVDYINELAVMNSASSSNLAEINRLLNELIDYTVTHFSYEEKLQAKVDYPFLKAHRRMHDIFKRKIGEYLVRAQAGENVAPELLLMLKEWLAKHIRGDDAHYAEMIRKAVGVQDGSMLLVGLDI